LLKNQILLFDYLHHLLHLLYYLYHFALELMMGQNLNLDLLHQKLLALILFDHNLLHHLQNIFLVLGPVFHKLALLVLKK
jgi:hypothetical protein